MSHKNKIAIALLSLAVIGLLLYFFWEEKDNTVAINSNPEKKDLKSPFLPFWSKIFPKKPSVEVKYGTEIVQEMFDNSGSLSQKAKNFQAPINAARLGKSIISKPQLQAMYLRNVYEHQKEKPFLFLHKFAKTPQDYKTKVKAIYNKLYQNSFQTHLKAMQESYQQKEGKKYIENTQPKNWFRTDLNNSSGIDHIRVFPPDTSIMNLQNQNAFLRRLQEENF